MPLTQEKRLDSITNNNDHSYLHKKFKKMASTVTAFPANAPRHEEQKDGSVSNIICNTSISNGSIAASHPEIQKIKENPHKHHANVQNSEKNVQIILNNENARLYDVNIERLSGQTSFATSTDEFSNKTENLENDFTRETYNGGTGGRYICPYCKLSCAKPSVLQKHIRAHTNERPYPCIPCGFAFKTKSNLYKHRRSRTHALRLQGADVSTSLNEEDLSGGSESDTSLPPVSDAGSDASIIHLENLRPNEFSSPELSNDRSTSPKTMSLLSDKKGKTIYKPKFRAKFYEETEDKDKKKTMSPNADFLTEHISKIISDNEAIVDVIETPLQKKYGKIKQIAESKQFLTDNSDIKTETSPLNLSKQNIEIDNAFRKRSHSESFSNVDNQKHPLNPEGSIIKDLLLKTKANGVTTLTGELDGLGPIFICPVCQIMYRSAENLEIHRTYYCKANNTVPKEVKPRQENVFLRSKSINVRLPETHSTGYQKLSTPSKSPTSRNKPDNLVIIKPESSEVVTPLPSPGPLLGNTRLVDTRVPPEYSRKNENVKTKSMASPKRRLESRRDTFSPRLSDDVSPRPNELYPQSKIRCIESNSIALRSLEEISQHMRHNSTSLQMFGGEVKIVDHSGGTTTLRIEPSKNQLSPILIQPNLSPSKLNSDTEASSVVVRSGLHSGGTIVHNPSTPKEIIVTPQPHTPRISISTVAGLPNSNMSSIHDRTHFQFPPLSAITAYNPLTLPPLSTSQSPNGATTILHGGKLIPHVPGMPGPNTPGIYASNHSPSIKNIAEDIRLNVQIDNHSLMSPSIQQSKGSPIPRLEQPHSGRGSIMRSVSIEPDKRHSNYNNGEQHYMTNIPIIKIKNVDEGNITVKSFSTNISKPTLARQEVAVKRNSEGIPRTPVLKENVNYTSNRVKTIDKLNLVAASKSTDTKPEPEIRHFNFENFITKAEIYNNQISTSTDLPKHIDSQESLTISTTSDRSETYFPKNTAVKSEAEGRKPKFLRPSTLPLKPGTFTPKRHHGITPTANTMSLVSPETPRPAKAYGQLFLNGNAYTYLGLKCSTKVFYCTINRPQPTYVPNQHFLSMYSNWQLLSELTPDPLGLSASSAMALYDSRHRPQSVAVAVIKQDLILTHSSQWKKNVKDNKQSVPSIEAKRSDDTKLPVSENTITPKKELTGGFESNEEYTYVRGRGRGRYVCSECGIRCKKPSMLKKHIRTHTDVRPYTCIHCAFSFKTKGNLTKHMKSKAHFKKCYELGINPNEGNDLEGGELNQCSGETDDDTESDGDEGNEGETESSDTEICKSRLPEHEAAHCLLSLGGSRPATSATPGLITSARPSTYPYTPAGLDNSPIDHSPEKISLSRSVSVDSRTDTDNEPMDLSKAEVKANPNIPEIPTARESSVLASLASNTAKLPQHQTQWSNGEPMLHTYLTERALLDTKIKQSQLTTSLSKLRKIEMEKAMFLKNEKTGSHVNKNVVVTVVNSNTLPVTTQVIISTPKATVVTENDISVLPVSKTETPVTINDSLNNTDVDNKRPPSHPQNSNADNAKYVVSEYLKHARINHIKTLDDNIPNKSPDNPVNNMQINTEETNKEEELIISEGDIKMPPMDHEPIARKVVIGAGGVAFKVAKGKEFENNASYSPGRLMEDGRRVCDFCQKTFTKPSQLRLHLNIHYMERPYRCSACAVSFRTRGHLQKHERSGSHHNKVSMTSTFGAATSLNPRPFRCSDCNIAFRIHGHLAKHLRSKMHVMRLECLFKLPFGTFTEIERAGVSLTDIDTTDCESSLASLQSLARKLHEKDPTKLEYREPSSAGDAAPAGRDTSEDEEAAALSSDKYKDSDKESEMNAENSDDQVKETRVNYSATDN